MSPASLSSCLRQRRIHPTMFRRPRRPPPVRLRGQPRRPLRRLLHSTLPRLRAASNGWSGSQMPAEQRFLGELLVRRGVVAADKLEALWAVQRERGTDLLDLLVHGSVVDEMVLARALGE